MPKRILCILPHPTQYDPPLWAALTRRGVLLPRVIYCAKGAPVDPEIGIVPKWGIPLHGYDWRTSSIAGMAGDVRLAFKEGCDAVLVTGWQEWTAWIAWALAKLNSVATIICSDKTINEKGRGVLREAPLSVFHTLRCRLFDFHLTTGILGTELLGSYGVGEQRVAQGLYPVDVRFWQEARREQAQRSQEIRESFDGQDNRILLVVSKMSAREAPLEIIHAFSEWSRRDPKARLVFVGDGVLRPEVEKQISLLGLSSRVLLAGHVPYRELAGHYGAADAFLHMPHREPWGISVLESLACGVPVVATAAVGSAADVVIDGVTGWLADRNDPITIASAIASLCDVLPSVRKKDLIDAAQRFDVETVSDALENLLLGAAGKPSVVHGVFPSLKEEFLNSRGKW